MGLLALFMLFSLAIPVALSDSKPSAYEVLGQYNFPVGILPKGVTSYELNRETGEFSAYINKTCSFSVDSYELEYGSRITGVIFKDRIKNLEGVKVKVFLLWLSIVEVIRQDNGLQFSVGIASAKFSISNFSECPQCGCGFDCNDFLLSSS